MQCLVAVAVFKNFNVRAFGVFLAQTSGEFHFAVNDIVMPDEAPHKTDHDDGCGSPTLSTPPPRRVTRGEPQENSPATPPLQASPFHHSPDNHPTPYST